MKYILKWLLLSIFILLAVSVMFKTAVTSDEPNYITAGYTYWKTADFRLNFEHPPLAKLIAGFPLLFIHPIIPINSVYWNLSEQPEQAYSAQWYFSEQFFYNSGNAHKELLFLGRLPFILLGLLLAVFVYTWASELYNENAGIFALFLYVFSPHLLAYTSLAITDFALTAFFFIAVYYFWKWRSEKSVKMLVLSGIFLGLANATKLTGLYLIPIFGIILFLEVLEKKEKILSVCMQLLIICFIAFFIVSASYFFLNISHYSDAFSLTKLHSEAGHPSYLLGEYSTQGWWYYFIIVFFVKTPLPFLIFLAISFVYSSSCLSKKYLLIPTAFYFAAFMLNNINVGIRHILPVYLFLIVFLSNIINTKLATNKLYKFIFIILGVWYACSSLFMYPHYISYFNEIIGSDNGQKVLLDSNIDWGQDVWALDEWIKENSLTNTPVYYSVFSIESVEYRFIINKTIPCMPHAGLYIISVNRLYDLGQVKQGCLEWLRARDPSEKIGYSIFIYNISDPELIEQENICLPECKEVCSTYNKTFKEYFYIDECVCDCS